MDWGQVVPDRFRGGPVGPPAFPRALGSPAGGRPPLRPGTPRHASVGQFGAHAGPEGDPLIGLGPRRPACSTVRPRPPPTAVRPPRAGRPGGRRGAMGADRARGGPLGKEGPQRPTRRPLDDPGAHRVGDLGSSSLRGRTDRGRQVVADAAHRHAPGRITPMDHQRLARPGRRCPLSPPAAARGQPARPLGATGPGGPRLRINGPWRSRFPVLGRSGGADPPLPQPQMIGRPRPRATLRAKRTAVHRPQ